MRCLYCGKQLPLLRRLTGSGEFCSDAHKHSYHEEYNRLALTRLIAAQSKPNEPKPSLLPTSNNQPADSQTAKSRSLPQDAAINGHWSETREKPLSRLLETSLELDPPPLAHFFLQRPTSSVATIPEPSKAEITNAAEIVVPPNPPDWAPTIDLVLELPTADSVPFQLLPGPEALDQSIQPILEASNIELPPTVVSEVALPPADITYGFQPRTAPRLELDQFAPDLAARPQIVSNFERFNFAVMIFGAPPLPILNADLTPLTPVETAPVSDRLAETFAQLPVAAAVPPEPGLGSSIEALRAAASTPFVPNLVRPDPNGTPPRPVLPSLVDNTRSAKLNLASLNANLTQEPTPRPAPASDATKPVPRTLAEMLAPTVEQKPAAGARTGTEKIRPQLPTIPPRRKTVPIPSILQTADADPDKGIWSTLRRYIKR